MQNNKNEIEKLFPVEVGKLKHIAHFGYNTNHKLNVNDTYIQDIAIDISKYEDEDETIKELICKHGKNAMRYLLSLQPFYLDTIDFLVYTYSIEEARCDLIIEKYFGKLPKKQYKSKTDFLNKYYDINEILSLKCSLTYSQLNGFICSKADLKKKLLKNGISFGCEPIRLKTGWSVDHKPIELCFPALSLKHSVLAKLYGQDCGKESFETYEQLRDAIYINYDKPIDGKNDADPECKEYELLNLADLKGCISHLLIDGIIFFNAT